MSAPTPPNSPSPAAADGVPHETRDGLLRLLDRETAIARATDGRLAVLLVELRRVDRLHALLRGPNPATTMTLVLERLRKALRDNLKRRKSQAKERALGRTQTGGHGPHDSAGIVPDKSKK